MSMSAQSLVEIAQQPKQKQPKLKLDVPTIVNLYSHEFGEHAIAFMCGVKARHVNCKNKKLNICGEVTRTRKGMRDHQRVKHGVILQKGLFRKHK